MDCSFQTAEGRFNFRVGAVIVHNGMLLGDGGETGHFHYLPGGRVRLGETMEQALCRELREEMGVTAKVLRPLWLWESYFPQDQPPHHGLELFFLVELDWAALPSLTEPFSRVDTDGERHYYHWLELGDSPDFMFPDFVQKSFPRLPERLTFVRTGEDRPLPAGDCKFRTEEGLFNFRVAGVFRHQGRLLAMKDHLTDEYYYLPGGRVRMHETMEEALCREAGEELGVEAGVVRPLWLCESFFVLNGERVHELAMYYLAELEWEKLPCLNGAFALTDTDGAEHDFFWLTEEEVREGKIYPVVLGEGYPELPEGLTLATDERDRDKR